jgi:WhiB family redox-sensing transcriptional regulator
VGSTALVVSIQSAKYTVPDFTKYGTPHCAGTDPDSFFPERNGTIGYYEIKAARRICNGCPYRIECLEWALEHREQGIWGGTTELDRKRMRRARRESA